MFDNGHDVTKLSRLMVTCLDGTSIHLVPLRVEL